MTCRFCFSDMNLPTELPILTCDEHPEFRVCPHCGACQAQAPLFSVPKLERLRSLMEDFT
jgi:hypothetical protein